MYRDLLVLATGYTTLSCTKDHLRWTIQQALSLQHELNADLDKGRRQLLQRTFTEPDKEGNRWVVFTPVESRTKIRNGTIFTLTNRNTMKTSRPIHDRTFYGDIPTMGGKPEKFVSQDCKTEFLENGDVR